MGNVHTWYGPPPNYMVSVECFRSIPRLVSRFLPIIILYQPSVELSTCHFHVMIFFALRSGKDNSTFTIKLVVKSPACVFHSTDIHTSMYYRRVVVVLTFFILRNTEFVQHHAFIYNFRCKLKNCGGLLPVRRFKLPLQIC